MEDMAMTTKVVVMISLGAVKVAVSMAIAVLKWYVTVVRINKMIQTIPNDTKRNAK